MRSAHTAPAWFTEERVRCHGWAVIALVVLLVYWPLSTFQFTTDGGDTFDCWLPWRWFITLALKNGELPLWNPLTQMGYPVYADLQGPAWYPEAIALGGTIGHSIWTLQALFLLYVIIGGVGFMRLGITVHGDARIGLVTGLAYALSGFFAAHQMHFYSIISAAWMPWFLAFQLELMRAPRWRPALSAALVMMLMLTGGNHTFTIIVAYLMIPLFGLYAIRHWQHGGGRTVVRLLGYEFLFLCCTLILACGTFYAWIEVSPYLGRMHGLSYALCSEGPANLTTLPTLLFPALFGKNHWSLGTQPAMANGYMGVLMLAFAGIALLRRRTAVENVLGAFGLCCFLLAFATDLPFHRFAWRWIPGLNVFRFPNYYLLFTVISALLLAAGSLRTDAAWYFGARRSWLIGLGGLLLVGFVLILSQPDQSVVDGGPGLQRSLFERVRALSYTERMITGWSVTAGVLMAALLLAFRGRLSTGVVLGLVVLEMGWNTHLSVWNSAANDLHPSALHARLAQVPQGPVVPDMLPMATHHDSGEGLHFLWRNTQTFLGMPTREGFNSFWPSHTYSLLDEHADLASAMERQPLLYLTDNVRNDERSAPVTPDSTTVLISGAIPNGLHRSPEDNVQITDFSFAHLSVRSSTLAPTFLVVQQTWFPGWSIRIDGAEADVVRANVAAFGCVLPAGGHQIDIRFEKPLVPWLMGLSMTAFAITLFLLCLTHTGSFRRFALAGTTLLTSMIAWSLLAHTRSVPANSRVEVDRDRQLATEGRTVLFDGPDRQAWSLFKGHEYSPAFRIGADSLLRLGHRSLSVSVHSSAAGRCKGLLVFQRTAQGKTTDYEAVRFVSADTLSSGSSTFTLVRDMREFRYPDEEVSIYAWNQGPDTLQVERLRISTSPHKVR